MLTKQAAVAALCVGFAAVVIGTTATVGNAASHSASASICTRAGQIVERYDIFAPGASRKGYLVLLHKLQRDCPLQAKQLGLTGDFLAKCVRLNQEDCTMYAAAQTLPPENPKPTQHAPLPPSAQQKVRSILLASVSHYEEALFAGERAVGTTQYSSAMAGIAAFDDPHSAASRLRDWRKQSNAEFDLSLEDAFSSADSYYTASNEPDAISTWREDMMLAQAALYQWVNLAVDWQIREHTTAQLLASEKRVEGAFARARTDVTAILAGR